MDEGGMDELRANTTYGVRLAVERPIFRDGRLDGPYMKALTHLNRRLLSTLTEEERKELEEEVEASRADPEYVKAASFINDAQEALRKLLEEENRSWDERILETEVRKHLKDFEVSTRTILDKDPKKI